MIDRFLDTLRALAALPPTGLVDRDVQALVADCADALRLELDCPQQDFTQRQRTSLRALDDALANGSAEEVHGAAAATCAILGITLSKPEESIILAPHNAAWARQFESEAAAIAEALSGLLIEIHHVGSTSIPGIVAKPVIDVLGVVASVEAFDAHASRLASLGYEGKGEHGIPGRRYFRKHAPDGTRTHHLHVFAAGSPEIQLYLDFRDYLRAFPAEAAAYASLKQELAARYRSDRIAYTDGKTDFVRAAMARAAAWRGR